MRVCIYTSIYGAYDHLKPQPAQSTPTDFVCFTDDVDGTRPPWILLANRDRRHLPPRMRAKYFKLLSHRVFPGGTLSFRVLVGEGWRTLVAHYDFVVWIDGSAQILTETFVERIVSRIDESGWAMFDHPERNCIYEEAAASRGSRKYDLLAIEAQVEHYWKEGFPPYHGLSACGLIARATGANSRLEAVNEMWWEENLRWGYQDQLSLPVVLWRLGHSYAKIPGNLWLNDLIAWRPHRHEKLHL